MGKPSSMAFSIISANTSAGPAGQAPGTANSNVMGSRVAAVPEGGA